VHIFSPTKCSRSATVKIRLICDIARIVVSVLAVVLKNIVR
jgi:hypothetical protein